MRIGWKLITAVALLVAASMGGPAVRGATIPHPHFLLRMRDASGTFYAVYIFARDEKVESRSNRSMSGNETDYTGHYQAALLRKGWVHPRVQNCALYATRGFFGVDRAEFGDEEGGAYVMRGLTRQEPDILVVDQRFGSDSRNGRFFFVRNDRLVPILLKDPLTGSGWWEPGTHGVYEWVWDGAYPKHTAPFHFVTTFWNHSDGEGYGAHRTVWLFEPQYALFQGIHTSPHTTG